MTLTKIRKRDGRLAEFNEEKIARAIEKAFNATYKPGRGEEARKLADEVLSILEVEGQAQPDVEHIQDLVERVLMDNGYVPVSYTHLAVRRAQDLSASSGQIPHLRPEKCFLQRTCRRRKQILIFSRLRARTLRGSPLREDVYKRQAQEAAVPDGRPVGDHVHGLRNRNNLIAHSVTLL